MKRTLLVAFAFLTPLLWAHPARAADPDQVRQLLATNTCEGCDLVGADLRQAHLIGADLRNANLAGAQLQGANLEGADLTGANLKSANLTDTFLTNASLNLTHLEAANFTRARLYNVEAKGAVIANINLTDVKMWGTPISVGGE